MTQARTATNRVALNTVETTLRSQASAFGSNLSVVQTRQDFNTSLLNALETGAANLTQADINLEAANSKALSTRQSLSISTLSLANPSQQSVLQLRYLSHQIAVSTPSGGAEAPPFFVVPPL